MARKYEMKRRAERQKETHQRIILGFRLAYDSRMTLAIYAYAIDGMQHSTTAALEEVFP